MRFERLRNLKSKLPGLRRTESKGWTQVLREMHDLSSSDDVYSQALEWLGDPDYAWQGAELAVDRHISPSSLRDENVREIIRSDKSPDEKWSLLSAHRQVESSGD